MSDVPPPTALDFALVAGAIYGKYLGDPAPLPSVGDWVITSKDPTTSFAGFKGGLYIRSRRGVTDVIAAICGTEGFAGGGRDVETDLGFGGIIGGAVLMAMAPGTAIKAKLFIANQSAHAIALANRAKALAQSINKGRPFVTGHSLGGGLAQIAAAYSGVRAVTFNPAACTGAFAGIEAAYKRGGGSVVNFPVEGDLINGTSAVGDFLGDYIMLGRHDRPNKGACHSIAKTAEQMAVGCFQGVGAMNPFWFVGRGPMLIAPNSGRLG